MGLVMNTGSVKSQLEAMNTELDAVIVKVSYAESVITQFDNTRWGLTGKAYETMREVYNQIHMPILKGIDAYAEALRMQNNTYKIYIESFLSGMGYFDENALKRDKQSLEAQISYVKNAMMTQTGGYSSYLGCLERALEVIKKKLEKIDNFINSSANLYNGLDSYVNSLKKGIEYIENIRYSIFSEIYNLEKPDMLWVKDLEDICRKKNRIIFYDNLPENMKLCLNIDDFMYTDDGFVICTKSLEDILLANGLEKIDIVDANNNKVEDFDDWYLAGIVEDGTTTYTFVKIRELGDKDEPGTSVPFIAVDIKAFDTKLGSIRLNNGQLSEVDKQVLLDISKDIVYGNGKVNNSLLEYFRDPASDGSYLIADILVQKTIESGIFDANGNYTLQHAFNENVSQAQDRLNELEKLGIYNSSTNSIHINDLSNLTEDEKDAIIVTTTGNPNKYAYAAENQYHAAMYGKWFGALNGMAIKSDAAVGESKNSDLYEHNFKDEDGTYYKEQVENHKDN